MSDNPDFTPNPMFMYGRIDTSAGEGGESLHKVNPTAFGVSAEGTIGRGAEVDGPATPDDVTLEASAVGTTIEPDPDTKGTPEFAAPGGTIDTGPNAAPIEEQVGALTPADEALLGEDANTVEGADADPADGDQGSTEDTGDQAPAKPDPEAYHALRRRDDLVAYAESFGVDTSGTMAEITALLDDLAKA